MIERFFHEERRGGDLIQGGEGGLAWVDGRPARAKVRSPRFHRCVGYKRLLGYLAREATGQYLASAAGFTSA